MALHLACRLPIGCLGASRSGYEESSHPDGYDTDDDGLADEWEEWVIASGAADSLAAIDHTTDLDGDGYPSIEEFLAWRARCPAP